MVFWHINVLCCHKTLTKHHNFSVTILNNHKNKLVMGSGAPGSNNNKITRLDMAEITYFNQQIQRMKFGNEKNGFKNKTKETNHAIDEAILKLRQDKLLDSAEMKGWNKKGKQGKKGLKDGKELKKSVAKIAIDHDRIKTRPSKLQKIQTQAISPGGQQATKKHIGQIGRRYLMEQNKIKSQNKLLQYESLNPSLHVAKKRTQVHNTKDY